MGASQHVLLPRAAKKHKTKEREKTTSQSGHLHPYSSVPSGVDSTSISTSISASSPPPAGRPGSHPRVPRGARPLSPDAGGGGPPPQRELAGLLLGGAGISPRPMRAPEIGTLGGRM